MSPLPSPHFPPELDEFCQALRRHRWRGLVWLQGEAGRCRERAWRLWGDARWQAPLWVAPESPDGIAASSWLPASKARTRLGGEQDLIVFDAASPGAGFDPEAFGALSGTLRAGGLMVLLTPTDWARGPMPTMLVWPSIPGPWRSCRADIWRACRPCWRMRRASRGGPMRHRRWCRY